MRYGICQPGAACILVWAYQQASRKSLKLNIISKERKRASAVAICQSQRLRFQDKDNEKKRGYETPLYTKTVSSKSKACGQNWKTKEVEKRIRSKKREYVWMGNFKGFSQQSSDVLSPPWMRDRKELPQWQDAMVTVNSSRQIIHSTKIMQSNILNVTY